MRYLVNTYDVRKFECPFSRIVCSWVMEEENLPSPLLCEEFQKLFRQLLVAPAALGLMARWPL